VGCGAVALALTGCLGSHYRPSYSMADVQAKPASLLVARKIPRTLVLVVDPARVPDAVTLHESTSFDPKGGEHFQLLELRRFVTRDLREALANYFDKVEVVSAGTPMPSEPHVVGDVKIDRVQLHSVPVGGLTYTIIEMTWGLGLRPGEAQDYAFTVAAEAKSSESYPTFEVGMAQLVESAILGLNKVLTEKGGLDALQKAIAEADAPKEAAPEKPADKPAPPAKGGKKPKK
jgi:hypothetical protein